MSMNEVTLQGTIATDIGYLLVGQNSTPKAHFRLNVPDRQGKDEWIPVVCWQGTAEYVVNQFDKGSSVKVIGKVSVNKWKKDDQWQERVEVTGFKVEALSGSQPVIPDGDDVPF